MGRIVSTDLQNLLDLESCETQTTVDLASNVDNAYDALISTSSFTVAASPDRDYTDDLRQTDDLKQSIYSPPDRVNISIQNVDTIIGQGFEDEAWVKGEGIVGRYYTDPAGVLPAVWVELFRGEARATGLDEAEAKMEILHDLAAAGYCVGDWSLAENCQFKFKDTNTCGYSGGITTCNKRWKSTAGCQGRSNEFHFGGMEFPDVQAPFVPTSGDPGGGEIFPTCPRDDQWIPVRGHFDMIAVRLAAGITTADETWCPVCQDFHEVESVQIVKDQPIWDIATKNFARGFSSYSHPIIRDKDDQHGTKCCAVECGDPVLTSQIIRNEDSLISRSEATGELGNVVLLTLKGGCKIYCYGNSRVGPFVVCHNAKPIE